MSSQQGCKSPLLSTGTAAAKAMLRAFFESAHRYVSERAHSSSSSCVCLRCLQCQCAECTANGQESVRAVIACGAQQGCWLFLYCLFVVDKDAAESDSDSESNETAGEEEHKQASPREDDETMQTEVRTVRAGIHQARF